MVYFIKTPNWLKKVFSGRIWEVDTAENELYLSFDDGPHPEHTTFVLNELKKYDAKATFFCIGKNVVAHPHIYQRIIEEGHAVGNHTQNHMNGWNNTDADYLNDIKQAKQYIDTNLFRPPYGKMSRFQVNQLLKPAYKLKTVMWTVLSGDFDLKISEEQCLQNVLLNAGKGSIVVFHDSEKASKHLHYALPRVLAYYKNKGYQFRKIVLETA